MATKKTTKIDPWRRIKQNDRRGWGISGLMFFFARKTSFSGRDREDWMREGAAHCPR